jgi:hypothetical protein
MSSRVLELIPPKVYGARRGLRDKLKQIAMQPSIAARRGLWQVIAQAEGASHETIPQG